MQLRLAAAAAAAAVAVICPSSALAVFEGVHAARHGSVELDRRGERVAPTAAQRAAVERLGARATFGAFGTPASLIRDRGALARDVPGADAPARARAFLNANRELFRLSPAEVDALEVLHDSPLGDRGRAVLLRQRFGDLHAAGGGLVAFAFRDADVVYASSTLAPGGPPAGEARLRAQDAYVRAARALGADVELGSLRNLRSERGWATFDVTGVTDVGRARLVALAMPGAAARLAYETIVLDLRRDGADPLAVTTFVDAQTGKLLLRRDNVDRAQAEWDVFPASPPLASATAEAPTAPQDDPRARWCWEPKDDCRRPIGNSGTPERSGEWDSNQASPDRDALPSFTTTGNAAETREAHLSPFTPGGTNERPVSRERRYTADDQSARATWTNQWAASRCDPEVFATRQRNDIGAAVTNLFAQHNRMHDWAYRLGFTEEHYNLQSNNFGRYDEDRALDPEIGNAQAGAVDGGAPSYLGRDNANQITLNDGIAPITNMYLWQPIAGGFYSPCVDGDYDMSVIGHEYTHAISNRMVAGPDDDLATREGGSMGESWSDLDAVEYLNAYRLVPTAGENPFAVGPYVTGDLKAGIRNHGMNASPLNYANVGYDLTGAQVHADGEIWSATNFDIRQALIERHGAGDPATQAACADGERAPEDCPGNRRWIQIVFDAFLLMQPDVSMVTARDAYLAAERARFGGGDQDLLWAAFARRGLGEDAAADPRNLDFEGTETDVDARPSFGSPVSDDESTVTFAPSAPDAQLLIGDYEARTTPVADTDPATALGADERLMPGTYDFVARADGYGARKFRLTIPAGQSLRLEVPMTANVASAGAGATATGDVYEPPGEDPTVEEPDPAILLRNLIDDREGTTWAGVTETDDGDPTARGSAVVVDLAGGEHLVDRVHVSALLRPRDVEDPGGDRESQNRFTALRRFALEGCTADADTDCAQAEDFARFYTSPEDAFPAIAPRPRVPELNLRGFDVPDARMTHLRFVVLENQCTGGPAFQGDQDADEANETDCPSGSARDEVVRAAELQAFSSAAAAPRLVDTAPRAAAAPAAAEPGAQSEPQPGAPGRAPSRADDTAFPCRTTAGLRSARAAGAGRGVRMAFRPTAAARVQVDVFQVSRGRTILGERLVARFRGRRAGLRWDGRANRRGRRVTDGFYVVRLRAREQDGAGIDTRRIAMRRSRGRFGVRPAFSGRSGCGLLRSYKLERPVFGGRTNRALHIALKVGSPADVTVQVLRGTRVVRTLRPPGIRSAATQRLRVAPERLRRGDHRVRIIARRGGETVTRTLTARRL